MVVRVLPRPMTCARITPPGSSISSGPSVKQNRTQLVGSMISVPNICVRVLPRPKTCAKITPPGSSLPPGHLRTGSNECEALHLYLISVSGSCPGP